MKEDNVRLWCDRSACSSRAHAQSLHTHPQPRHVLTIYFRLCNCALCCCRDVSLRFTQIALCGSTELFCLLLPRLFLSLLASSFFFLLSLPIVSELLDPLFLGTRFPFLLIEIYLRLCCFQSAKTLRSRARRR